MAQSNAERQAVYRQRHLREYEATGERLQVVIDGAAKRALQRLARVNDLTQRQMLERLLIEAQHVVVSSMDSEASDAYFRL